MKKLICASLIVCNATFLCLPFGENSAGSSSSSSPEFALPDRPGSRKVVENKYLYWRVWTRHCDRCDEFPLNRDELSTDGDKAIHIFTLDGDVERVKHILYLSSPNVLTKQKKTALILAVSKVEKASDAQGLVRELITHSANPLIEDAQGNTAADYAQSTYGQKRRTGSDEENRIWRELAARLGDYEQKWTSFVEENRPHVAKIIAAYSVLIENSRKKYEVADTEDKRLFWPHKIGLRCMPPKCDECPEVLNFLAYKNLNNRPDWSLEGLSEMHDLSQAYRNRWQKFFADNYFEL